MPIIMLALLALLAMTTGSANAAENSGWVIICRPDPNAKATAQGRKSMICGCEPVKPTEPATAPAPPTQ